MKRMKIKRCHVVSLLLCLLLATSCQPVVEEIPSDKYDTLRLYSSRCFWHAAIMHLYQDSGYLRAHVGITIEVPIDDYDYHELDSIPYIGYHIYVDAHTQDTLLPLGKYTTHIDDTCHISVEECWASGARTKKWYKPAGRYAVEDATIYIGKDEQQEYYLELFVQMQEGERLYIRCKEIWRLEEHRAYLYYPDMKW